MSVDLSKLMFWSGVNYMKREDREVRYQDVVLNAFQTKTIDIDHDLGHIPEYDVWAELLADGMIWTGTLPEVGMSGFYSPAYAQISDWIGTDTLTITVANQTGSGKTVRVYYLIYKDYA